MKYNHKPSILGQGGKITGRMNPRKVKRSNKVLVEKWYTGKVYLHVPFIPFKVRVA
jgi:hypothetical protein